MHIRNYLAALEFANRERKAMGLEPLEKLPAGAPGSVKRCAIARAVPGSRVAEVIRLPSQTIKLLPGDVQGFVSSFDSEGRGQRACDPGKLVDGGIDDEKGTLVPA